MTQITIRFHVILSDDINQTFYQFEYQNTTKHD